LHGDQETGVTIMKLDEGMDTGPILTQRTIPIHPTETGGQLSTRLADAGANLLLETLPGYLSGQIKPTPQPEDGVSTTHLLKKADGQLDLTQKSVELERKVRAFDPWPGTFIPWGRSRMKILKAKTAKGSPKPGQRGVIDDCPAMGAADGWLVLLEVQPAGKKPMPGDVFLRGERSWID
jgi:methionyl-tRNA formyltransferase